MVVGITRSGYVHAYRTDAPACSPSSSPRFHHDNANSGDYLRDAVLPGVVGKPAAKRGRISFTAPGDDLLCGTADHYEMATAKSAIDESDFDRAKPLRGAPKPRPAGTRQTLAIPAKSKGFVAIRAVDDQGNVGRVASIRAKAKPEPPVAKRCANRIAGTEGADRIRGTRGGDRINGRGGRDRIDGRGGADCIRGGRGDDRLDGGDGRDRLRAGAGSDRISVRDDRRDRVRCGPGRDRVKADRKDRVAGSCERVRVFLSPAPVSRG